ncbi:uncharacterized protein N7483_012650 [Penicillium malachiteum]|uniref:uncharacterized protein n=1 Tax=Penicillium malachiteum TaxID=1324776 RepID=UPI002548D4C2|nr:uncharacterized protein N7483_012650 [Penicillium malachiteum]KAJ5715469.1 hypothetical protein N7483_012650 [Penicillium malachiteum]
MRWTLDDEGNRVKRPLLPDWAQGNDPHDCATSSDDPKNPDDTSHRKEKAERVARLLKVMHEDHLEPELDRVRLQFIRHLVELSDNDSNDTTADAENEVIEDQRQAENKNIGAHKV